MLPMSTILTNAWSLLRSMVFDYSAILLCCLIIAILAQSARAAIHTQTQSYQINIVFSDASQTYYGLRAQNKKCEFAK